MRVIRVERFGGPEVLVAVDAPEPVAEDGQVMIEVAAVDVIFVETSIRGGWGEEFFDVRPPYVPGGAVAGTVVSAGAGVEAGWVGRRVAARVGVKDGAGGGYAERVAVPAGRLAEVPEGLGLAEAAALLHDGPTALALLEQNGIRPGERVLILAAGGGMGVLLVQLARAAGARVVAAARGGAKLELARKLGADVAVDYTGPGWAGRVVEATGGAGPDLVLDGAGGRIGREAFEITAPGGRFSAHGAPGGGFTEIDPAEAGRRGITVRGIQHVQLVPAERDRLIGRALAEAAAGRLTPVIGRTFPLERAADAHAAIESRAVVGKTLLLP
ncbi:NADPH:quinone reductase [Actinomadura craniellae]|uniref:NADPH:quinone reductase n=1 Tax=Actinomadura craniellae TaxID=2231787 RepID=A0A365HCC9_9ACTN|nr:zinc-binding dehydrogenase [Actinomadura craniellae]RAY16689.1 NADPH:quinone reductase [Actinomadura craniellae]